jgi:hypothetical protein
LSKRKENTKATIVWCIGAYEKTTAQEPEQRFSFLPDFAIILERNDKPSKSSWQFLVFLTPRSASPGCDNPRILPHQDPHERIL